MERPTKCYVRREWFEAVSYLSPDLRCEFYEALMSFIYWGSEGDTLSPEIRGIFNLAKISLQNDISQYDRKVIVNRQNGSKNGISQRDITQKDPSRPKATQKKQYTYTYTEKEPLQVSFSLTKLQREKQILIEMFASGVGEVMAETTKMCDYYDARGWVDKGGNPIVDAAALARVWKKDYTSVYLANTRKKWADFLRSLPDDMPYILVTDFDNMRITEQEGVKIVQLYVYSQEFIDLCENKYFKQLFAQVKMWGAAGVEYCLKQKT